MSVPDERKARPIQWVAFALLLGAAVLYVPARIWESVHPAIGYVRAFCEAALIGGLADWFAVTALFRRPLGLPIPHTALIAANKDRIGVALGRFVEENFLVPEIVAERLQRVDLAALLARGLADPERAEKLSRGLAVLLPRMLDATSDESIRGFLHARLVEALERIELGPLAADLLEVLAEHDRHQDLVDLLLQEAERLLRDNEPDIRQRVRHKTAWLWKRVGLDEKIADRLIAAAEEALTEASRDPTHAWRQRFTALVNDWIARLRESPEERARLEAFKRALLAHPALSGYLSGAWDALRTRIRDDLAAPDSRLHATLRDSLVHLVEALARDTEIRATINAWAREAFTELARSRRHEVASLIADTVRGWDAETISRKLEASVGRDLQYIRINGTLIGGLVGVGLHLLSQMLS